MSETGGLCYVAPIVSGKAAAVDQPGPVTKLTVTRKHTWRLGDPSRNISVEFAPADTLTIAVDVDYREEGDLKGLAIRAEYDVSEPETAHGVCAARTFTTARRQHALDQALRKLPELEGLMQGDGRLNVWPDTDERRGNAYFVHGSPEDLPHEAREEFARHRAQDFLGALALLRGRIQSGFFGLVNGNHESDLQALRAASGDGIIRPM